MIYNKNNLLVHNIASTDESRPELNSLLFLPDRTVSTDSYKLLEVKNNSTISSEDIPILPSGNKPLVNFAKKGYIIPVKAVKKVLSNIPSKPSLPILKNCWFTTGADPKVSNISTTDLEQADTVSVRGIDGQYPDYKKIMPDISKDHRKITVNAKYLRDLCNTISKMSIDNIDIYIKGSTDPITIKAKTDNDQTVTGLLIPIKQ